MKDNNGWPTTRCYPRTLDEAFNSREWWHPPEKQQSLLVRWFKSLFNFWRK